MLLTLTRTVRENTFKFSMTKKHTPNCHNATVWVWQWRMPMNFAKRRSQYTLDGDLFTFSTCEFAYFQCYVSLKVNFVGTQSNYLFLVKLGWKLKSFMHIELALRLNLLIRWYGLTTQRSIEKLQIGRVKLIFNLSITFTIRHMFLKDTTMLL